MVTNFISHAKIEFVKKSYDIYKTFDLHDELDTTTIPLIKEKQKLIVNSTFIMITACWQTYIADITKESFSFLTKKFKSKSKKWIEPVLLQKKELLLGRFNTPSASNISELFEGVIGSKGGCRHWQWRIYNKNDTKAQLGDRIAIRGDIAHTNTTKQRLSKTDAEEYLDLIETLVNQTEQAIQEYVKYLTNKNLGREVVQ